VSTSQLAHCTPRTNISVQFLDMRSAMSRCSILRARQCVGPCVNEPLYITINIRARITIFQLLLLISRYN